MTQEAFGFGHNQGSAFDVTSTEDLAANVRDFGDTAGQWLDLKVLDTEEDASRLNDFLAGARKLSKTIDERRKAAKKPFDDAAGEVQRAFAPLVDALSKATQRVEPMLKDYLRRKAAEDQAERTRRIQEADNRAREAKIAADQAASRNDVVGEAAAEAAQKQAAALQKAAERQVATRVASATGGTKAVGLRTVRVAVLININQAFMAFRDAPEVAELLTTLAQRIVRAAAYDGASINGFNVETREV